MKSFIIMLQTGENLLYKTKEEVLKVMRDVEIATSTHSLVTISHMEGNATVHVFPQFVVGWKEVGGDTLQEILHKEEEEHPIAQTRYEMMSAYATDWMDADPEVV